MVYSSETRGLYLHLWREMTKNTSTNPNRFSIQYHYAVAPEMPVKSTAFAAFGGRKTWE